MLGLEAFAVLGCWSSCAIRRWERYVSPVPAPVCCQNPSSHFSALLGRRVSRPLPIPGGNPMPVEWPASSAHPQSGCRYTAGAVHTNNWDYLRQSGAVFVVQLKDGFVASMGCSFSRHGLDAAQILPCPAASEGFM